MDRQAGQNKKPALSERINLWLVVKGLLVSYFVILPLFIAFALVLTYTDFPQKYLPTVVIITTIVSVLAAGSTVTKNLRNKGWMNGGIVGLIYMAVLYFFSSLVYKDFTLNRYVITVIIIGILSGAIGGILGINLRKPSRVRARS